MHPSTCRPSLIAVLPLALVTTLAACAEPTGAGGPPHDLEAVGANAVSLPVGSVAGATLAVRVVDAGGRALPNVEVTWSADLAATVAPSPAVTVTDRQGIARTMLSAGTVARETEVTAWTARDTEVLQQAFQVTVTPGPIAAIEAPASVTVGAGATATVVLTGRDAHGNATAVAGVAWSSSDPAVAEGSGSGTVTGKTLGGARLTARVGDATAEFDAWVVPATISSCEWNTGTVCGNWTLQGDAYYATWSDDVTSTIRVVRFTASEVEFQRSDLTKNQGFTARYVGTVNGRNAGGAVTWTQHGFSWSGTWAAEW